MATAKHIIFTVTNDLNYDQRMIRICNSLQQAGYLVTLVGVKHSNSKPLQQKVFTQKRIPVICKKGKMFYVEYNIKLFFVLLFMKCQAICAIDLDTIVPVYFVSICKKVLKIYDAHEYFSQLKEVVTRPTVYKIWFWVERTFVPKFKHGYTVSQSITTNFNKLYKVNYITIRNIPVQQIADIKSKSDEKLLLYQGAINHARGFEGLIPAMQYVHIPLHIYGDGNYLKEVKNLIDRYRLQKKVILKGKLLPNELNKITSSGYIGINLVENDGLNQYYSLANKFFDYIQHGIPQVTMNFPEYDRINQQYQVAVLVNDIAPTTIADAINTLLINTELYNTLKTNCTHAANELTWQNEAKVLIQFYNNIFE